MDQTEPLDIPLINNRPTTKDAQYIYYNNIAILISTTSFFYNILEGAVSVYFGEVTDSLSLFFFGVQSFVEVLSSVIVIWKVMTSYAENKQQLKMEKRATVFIGGLFIFLCIGILIDGIFSLVDHSEPTTTVPNIIVSAIATVIMLFLYIIKKKLARELNSSTIQSDAQCSLACIRITVFLLFGSIIYHFWDAVWWIDGAMALVLGVLFGKEGVQMLLWASSKDFNGGCCGGCAKMPDQSQKATSVKVVCTTSLNQDEYNGFDYEDPVTKKVADKCCKAGKCSKKAENQSVISTQVIASGLESQDLMNYSGVAEVKPKSGGGCCKGGKCSKISENQKITPVDVILEATDKEEVELKAQQEVLVQPVPKKCCSGGGCKKTTESQVTVSTETRTISNEIEIKPQEEIVPEKKAGGCCKGGKCTKSSGNQIKTSPEIIPEAIVLEKVNQEQETVDVPAPKSCCKGGGCAKKTQNQVSAPVENPISLSVNEGFQTEIVEVKPEEQPIQKNGGCCKGGKCTKNQNPIITEPVPEVVIVDKVEPETQPVTKGCCKGGKCSKKTEENSVATDREISLI